MRIFETRRAIHWLFVLTLFAGAIVSPDLAAAQAGTPEPEVTTEASTSEVSPTAIETPTEASTSEISSGPTETGVETPTATVEAAAEASPPAIESAGETPPPNTDTISVSDPAQSLLEPGAQQPYTAIYTITTPRAGTTVYAGLRQPDGSPASGWTLRVLAGAAGWMHGDASVAVTDRSALEPGTSFALSLSITAPADIAAEQTVSLFLSSIASTDHGDETGIEADGPLATLTVLAPTPNGLMCDVPPTTEVTPGETAELSCIYTDYGSSTTAIVSASFVTAPGDGWTLAFGDGPAGKTAIWTSTQPLVAGQTIDLSVHVTAPADAGAGQQAAISVALDVTGAAASIWPIAVTLQDDASSRDVSMASVDPAGGICQQISPSGTDRLPPNSIPYFSCGLGGLQPYDLYEIRINAPSAGWEYQLSGKPYSTSTFSTYTPKDLLPNTSSTFYLGFRLTSFPDYQLDESVGTLTVEYMGWQCGLTGCGETLLRSATLSLIWPAPSVTCDLLSPEIAQVALGDFATFKCTHSNPPFQLTNKTSIDTHWQWSASTGQTPVIPVNWSTLSLGPTSGPNPIFIYIRANPSDPPAVASVLQVPAVFRQSGSYIETQTTMTLAYAAASCDPVAAFTGGASFGASSWDGRSYTPATGVFTISIAPSTASGCGAVSDGWSVTVQSGGLYQDGDTVHGHRIPPEAIAFQGTSAGGNTPPGLNPAAPTALDPADPVTIAAGAASSTGEWNTAFQLQPPNDAPPGNYSGTITVTVASGS